MHIAKNKDLAKLILKGLLITGAVAVASTSPMFVSLALPKVKKYLAYKIKNRKKREKRFYNTFYYLKKNDLINFENHGGQIYISLTKEGKKRAGKYQIDDLEIKKPDKWDGYWRILIFDIKDKEKLKREALRGKIKELGLFQLQKSVWVYPYEFQKEVKLLRSFFGLNQEEMEIITANRIENDKKLRAHFHLA
ncbi:MAG: hypothetical protein NTZ97_00115 [Candidatus Moranbacteria bacterium]|nr:hypothetical protein [Candidatus Moranbacteria bacterium]